MGLEQSTNSLGNTQSGGDVPMLVPISSPDLIELIDLWDALDESARDDLLRVARAWVGKK